MRHGNKVNNLSRKTAHRKAMLSNMACSLIKHKRINTTLAKAKALRVYIEPLLTKSKTDSTHSRRIVFSYLKDSFDALYLEGKNSPKMMSVGLHCRLIGRPGRIQSLKKFLNYVLSFKDVWICKRIDIAKHWIKNYK